MSLKKFLEKLWRGIASIFKKIDDEAKKLLPIVIDVVNQIKMIDDTHIGDVLAAVTKNAKIKEVVDKIHAVLPGVVQGLDITNTIANTKDPNEMMKMILSRINVGTADQKKVFYKGLVSLILEKISDGKFSSSDASAVAEYYYKNQAQLEAVTVE